MEAMLQTSSLSIGNMAKKIVAPLLVKFIRSHIISSLMVETGLQQTTRYLFGQVLDPTSSENEKPTGHSNA